MPRKILQRVAIACAVTAMTFTAAAGHAAESVQPTPQDGKIAYALVSLHWATYQTADGKTECPNGYNVGPQGAVHQAVPE